MNRRVRQAALRIMTLLEEFSAEELAEALALLGEGEERDLPAILARIAASAPRRASGKRNGIRATSPGETKSLQALKHTDPEKYHFLRAFEFQVREGAVLRTLADLRAFGEALTKTFGPVKSRKEALEGIMAELASRDLNSARVAIAGASSSVEEAEDGLRRFTNQLLSAVPTLPTAEPTKPE